MKPFKHFVAAILGTVLLSSCATTKDSITEDVVTQLNQDEGYLMFSVDTSEQLRRIVIEGRQNVQLTSKDLQAGSNNILITLPAGEYKFGTIVFDSIYQLFGPSYLHLKSGAWDFKIKPGVISYVGNIKVKRSYWGVRASYIMLDESSLAQEYLEQHFANLLSTYRVEYQGPGEDRFFDVIADMPKDGGLKEGK